MDIGIWKPNLDQDMQVVQTESLVAGCEHVFPHCLQTADLIITLLM